jgi:hypothetical protein
VKVRITTRSYDRESDADNAEGSSLNSKRTNLQTRKFGPQEVEHLVATLAERFVITANTRANKGRRIIYIPASSVGSLRCVIEPHILPELRYKLVPRRERTP